MINIKLFITRQMAECAILDPGCCAVPGQTEKEIKELVDAISRAGPAKLEVCDIRAARFAEEFPQAAELFKKYSYNALPILMAGKKIISYGISDKEFIINAIKKTEKR